MTRDLEALERDLDRCVSELREVARTAATDTAPSWRALVEAMTGSPPAALRPAGTAANPAEVRAVLVAVQRMFTRRLAGVVCADDDRLWTFEHRRLASLVETELAAYIAAVAPPPSVASAFARAAVRTSPSLSPVSRVQLLRCRTCAAPRHREAPSCAYCGHPFFEEHT
jgi:hypothetical protein